MVLPLRTTAAAAVLVAIAVVVSGGTAAEAGPQRILLDTDMDTDDLLALLYILKLNRSEFDLKLRLHDPSVFPCSLLCFLLEVTLVLPLYWLRFS